MKTSRNLSLIGLILTLIFFTTFFIQGKAFAIEFKPLSSSPILTNQKYNKWRNLKSQLINNSSNFSFDKNWKDNLPILSSKLNDIDKILLKLRNSSDSDIAAKKRYFKNLATQLNELEAYLNKHKNQLNNIDLKAYFARQNRQDKTLPEEPNLAQVDLQNMLQKQQQTLTAMSNVSKLLHDTAMAVARKTGIGGSSYHQELCASLDPINVPSKLEPSQTVTVQVKLKNCGEIEWDKTKFFLSYRWSIDRTGANPPVIVTYEGIRTRLYKNVEALGGNITVAAQLKAPAQEGIYRLRWDILYEGLVDGVEGFHWFSSYGMYRLKFSMTEIIRVEVKPTTKVRKLEIDIKNIDIRNKESSPRIQTPKK